MKKDCGVLLHITSLPSKYGIGCFSKEAYDFVDWLKDAGQAYWQILPIGPTSYGDSPYQSFSTFAGNPYFISLEALIEEGVLTEEECDAIDFGDTPNDVNFAKMYEGRYILLRKAYERSDISKNPGYQKFMYENSWWVTDYALFMALKNFFGGKPWYEWPEDISLRWGYALDYYRRELYFDIEFQQYMQFKVFEQYDALKKYANSKGVKIVGDIPIYVAMDSADTWANPHLFQLDEKNVPLAVAGCPPDAFAEDGQLWGNPLYRWDYHAQTGFEWWVTRMEHCFRMYDVTRIDHFRGFDEYFSIPYGDKTAHRGHWEKGPGIALFNKIKERLGDQQVIAEDLGYVTDTVRQLVRDTGYPNMKVVEFAFDARDTGSANDYLPHNYVENCVAYTGTHDNETLGGWIKIIPPVDYNSARDYLCDHHTPDEELYKSFIAVIMRSNAKICIVPLQDYKGYDNSCRMNKPSTIGINWRWRVTDELTDELQKELLDTAIRYGRASQFYWDEQDKLAAEAKKAAEAAKKAAEEVEEETEKEAE